MKGRLTVAGVAALFLIVGGAYYYLSGKEYVIRLTEADIRAELDNRLPWTETYLFIIRVKLSNPRVDLENGTSRVNAGMDVEFNVKVDDNPDPIGGSVDVSGGVRYDNGEGEFFLVDPSIEQLNVQGIAERYTDRINKALTLALSEYYQKNPIYSLSATDAKHVVARMVLKDVSVENEDLVITLGI